MAGRAITVEFLGNTRDLNNAMSQTESKSKRFGKSIAGAGKLLAGGLAVGAVGAAVGLAKLTQGAIEDEEAQKKLALAYKNNAKATDAQIAATEDWISAQGTALGVTDDELRPALSNLVAATKDVGEAQKLAALAMDISKAKGMSLETVSKALAKAQNGQVSGLAKLGIKTKDSVKDSAAFEAAQHKLGEQTKKYNETVKEHGKNSDEAKEALYDMNVAQEKVGETRGKLKSVTIDFDEAQKRLNDTYGGSAATAAETTAGKIQRLKVIMAEAGETIGAKLIPVVTKLADWFLKKGLPAISAFGAYLQVKLPPIFERVKTAVIDTFNKIKGPALNAFNDIKGVVMDFVSIVRSLWKKFGADIVQYARAGFGNAARVIKGIFNVIKGVFKVFSSLLKGDWKGVWDGIKTIVRGAGQALVGIVRQLGNILRFAFKAAWTVIKGIVSGAWDGIKNAVRNGFTNVIDYIRGVPGKIGDLGTKFFNAGKNLIGQFVFGLKGAAGLVSDIAGNIWDAVKGLLNDAIDKVNSALSFTIDLPGPKNLHVDVANIPHLAKGGVVKASQGGTLALLGEAGADEMVTPLSGPHAPKFGAMGGGTVVNITVNGAVDAVSTAKQLEKIFIVAQRSMSGPFQFKTI